MKKDKILLCISDLNQVLEFKKLGISNFLFPLKDYAIGYIGLSYREISKLDVNVYVLVNRILNDDEIDEFMSLDIPKNVKGFVIEDVGLFEELKGRGYELINFQNHLNNNYKTINYWLKYYDSLVVSTDITFDEINDIINNTSKPLVLNTFGYPMIMYSRRYLVSNFYRHLDVMPKREIDIKEKTSNSHFFLRENDYGTAVFDSSIYDYRSIIDNLDKNKIKYYLVNGNYIDFDIIKKCIVGDDIDGTTRGFLDKKTIYKVGDIK